MKELGNDLKKCRVWWKMSNPHLPQKSGDVKEGECTLHDAQRDEYLNPPGREKMGKFSKTRQSLTCNLKKNQGFVDDLRIGR